MMWTAVAGLLAVPAQAAEKASEEKIVCKKTTVTGWRLSTKRVCRTAAEWDALAREYAKEMNDVTRKGSLGNASEGFGRNR